MLTRVLLLVTLSLLISLKGLAQPPETIYQGTLIASGFRQSIPLASDGPFPIGFSFTFFGTSYSQFYTSANGLVMFTDPDGVYNYPAAIPAPPMPNNYIAPFWDNLSIVDGGKVLYRTVGGSPNRKCIIQYTNMGFDPVPTPLGTFTVILYETTNVIQIQYRLIVDPYSPKSHGANATIGLENSNGSSGVQFAYLNGDAVHTEDAISFTPSGSTNYVINPDAVYDGVFLTTNTTTPDPGIVDLVSPSADAVIGADQTFEWSATTNATSYNLVIDTHSDLSTATYYSAGTNLSYNITGLSLDITYYWGVFASNSTGTTWCEINRFRTSSAPPLTAVPREIWVALGSEREIKLQYTGGDASAKTAIVTSLPAEGHLYQVSGGVRGNLITTEQTTVTDPEYSLIYVADGATGNRAGSFNFKFHDGTGDSPDATITINVNPPGVPVLLEAARNNDVELQFDLRMNDPAGSHNQFAVTVDGLTAQVNSASLKTGDPYSIVLTLGTHLTGTETVLVSYSQGTVSATTGGLLASFTNQPVTLLAQTITFTTNLTKTIIDPPFGLSASSNSGLPITFSSSNYTVATISGNTVTLHAIGTSDITALQTGDATYAPARYVSTLTVSKANQTITFNPLPSKTVGDADFSPGATVTSGLTISYSSSNTSVATIVSGNIHIVAGGISFITASQAGNALYNAAAPKQQTLTVTDLTAKTLNLTVFLEGLYNGAGGLMKVQDCTDGENPSDMFSGTVTDTLTIQLAMSVDPYLIVYTVHGVPLTTNGTVSLNSIPAALSGSYYIIIKHRNHIETWSQIVSFAGTIINYNFTDAISKAWGDNMKPVGSSYCIFTGDTNKDQYVDGSDLMTVFINNKSGSYGYQVSDINGDGFVDGSDLMKVFINNKMGVGMNTPTHPLE